MLTVPSSCHSNCRLSGQVCFFVWAFPQQSPQSWIVVVRSSAPSRHPVSSKSAASRSTYVETLRYLSQLSKYANLPSREVFSVNSQPMPPLPSLNNKLGAREGGGRARVRERGDWDFVSCSWASQACSWRNAKKSKTCAEEVRKKEGWGKYARAESVWAVMSVWFSVPIWVKPVAINAFRSTHIYLSVLSDICGTPNVAQT